MGEKTATDVLEPNRVVRDPSDIEPGIGEEGEKREGKREGGQPPNIFKRVKKMYSDGVCVFYIYGCDCCSSDEAPGRSNVRQTRCCLRAENFVPMHTQELNNISEI